MVAKPCTFAALCLLFSVSAFAADYGLFISVADEDALLELLNAGEIDEETYATLLELMQDPVDLNEASREVLYSLPNLTYEDVDAILKYRAEVLTIRSLEDLAAAKVLDPEKVSALRPFVVVRYVGLPIEIHGRARYSTAWVATDKKVPPMVIRARLSAFGGFGYAEAGISGLVSRNRLSNVQYDETRQVLVANPPATRFYLPKYFVQWEKGKIHLILGTFRVGFGERLTLDNTGLERPSGSRPDDLVVFGYEPSVSCRESAWDLESPCKGAAGSQYEAPDFRWTDRFRGGAITLRDLNLGPGWVDIHAFGSYQTHGIYQYEIYDRNQCADPTDDTNPLCSAPPVLRWRGDPLAPTTRFSYQTLPDMYALLTAGGNVTYSLDSRTHFGLTGYGASARWLVQGIALDFQEWARLPYGGPFGALGANAAFGVGQWDFGIEFARSFDSQPAGGGYAGLIRATHFFGRQEIEILGRYYHINYANPFARPPSEPDEYDGLSPRDEAGIRVKHSGRIRDLFFASALDFWTWSTGLDGPLKLKARVRVDYKVTRWFKPGIYAEYYDKDLRSSKRGQCFEEAYETVEGETVPCAGERIQTGLVLRFRPLRDISFSLKYQHRLVDDNRTKQDASGRRYYVFGNRFRQDILTWFSFAYRPLKWLSVRGRLRYLNEDPTDSSYLEESLWGYLELVTSLRKNFKAKVRYEVYSWLDKRPSTLTRTPNPAHWLRADIEYLF